MVTFASNHAGFEDLRGGGDRDYNDLVFAFTNVNPSSQPVPGLAALVVVMKRQAAVRR